MSTSKHNALQLAQSPTAAYACVFSLSTDLLPSSGVHVSQEALESERLSIMHYNSARTLNLPHKFLKD